jgi:predicted ATPase/class 3 adenylate cyclase
MSELPTGTVSLLFSDIEGSTLLLNRLGPGYADALDVQRQVLRKAWAAHGGTELGTEGDSFFVVFPTAEGAVKAAAQAQRELEDYPWPGGERLRVRIGIHTGSPQVHDGNYVGMDVHRAARIAGSAHGGQVVVSSVTAELARGGLPDGVGLRDLGSHRLKDIAVAEHLFQLAIDGLQVDFPTLKTIGAASSLPVPATLLVGRDGEVAGLTALLRSPGVRLVTLTGPGGSGKTRLAIAVAQRLVAVFPDGVYFVALAAVTSADVMWTSIAEVLDVPPKERMPPGFFNYVAHRSALFVLDNLEQLSEADDVVAQLLAAAPQVAVIASSRRALSVPAEHRHRVPPLALPENSILADAEHSGAVQLFVQQARSIHPDFALTAENVAEVVAICRRLDGLPLAIELSAARMRLLSPKALLRRLDQALDIASTSRQGPSRQKTLRDTIAWSYDLLTPAQQAFFRRLGVFDGGGDLAAIAAITAAPTDSGNGGDPLDMVAALVDASLATITEGPDSEPRVAILETIRAYARDQLRAAGEADAVRFAHAAHYLQVAEHLQSLRESQHLVALGLAEIELENFREALSWTLQQDMSEPTGSGGVWIGVHLCSALGWLWAMGGYLVEGRRWYEQAIERAGESMSKGLAACLGGLADLLISQGESEQARDFATSSLTMARTLGDEERVAFALGVLGTAQRQLGDVDAARRNLQEALHLHRKLGNRGRLARTLGNLAGIEEMLSHFDRAEALTQESLSIFQALGDMHGATVEGQNLANLFVITGRVDEANQLAKGLVGALLELRSPSLTMAFANTYMNILIRIDEPVAAAHLFGAEEAMRERNAMPNPHQQEELQEAWTLVRELISVEDWEYHRRLGRSETVEDLLAQLITS